MKRMTLWLSAFVTLVLAVISAVPVAGQAAQATEPGSAVPDGLSAAGWQSIQDQVAKITALDGTAWDYFGTSVSVSGDTVVVGARSTGAAYVFYRNPGGGEEWDQVAKLTAADGGPGDLFGMSVAVDGDTAIVGAQYADIGGNALQGAAYVFSRDQGGPNASLATLGTEQQWGQVAKLTAADGAAWDLFGMSVAVDGDTAVVGAYLAAVGDRPDEGAAYVFYRDQGGANAWGQVAKLTPSHSRSNDHFGYSVSVSDDTAVVGAEWVRVGDHKKQGAAYVFYRNHGGPDAWGQVAQLTAANGAPHVHFGQSVSVDGDTAVVGVELATVGGNYRQGAAYVFYRDQGGPNAWGQVTKLTAADGAEFDRFGASVSIRGDIALVGAPQYSVGRGAAYTFGRDQGRLNAWGQVAKLTAADGAYYDDFGDSVSAGGDLAFVGAPRAAIHGNAGQGAVYIFSLATLHLSALELAWAYGTQPGTYRVTATMSVRDSDGAPAGGVTVYGDWTLPDGTIRHKTAMTNLSGQAKFNLWVTHAGSYQLCVTDMTKAEYVYNPDANEVPACQSLVVGP